MHKYSLVLIFSFLIIAASSCSKDNCTEISYNETFTIESGDVFCLPDGAELEILDLKNEFCPCNITCIWEGEMRLEVIWIDASGKEGRGEIGTHADVVTPMNTVLEGLRIITEADSEITFEQECTANLPSPDIIKAEIMVIAE